MIGASTPMFPSAFEEGYRLGRVMVEERDKADIFRISR